jgi:hypothetical protein
MTAAELPDQPSAETPDDDAALDDAAAPDDDTDDIRWVGFVRADDRTGTVAALAGVFATRGGSIDSLATGDVHGSDGLVVVTFRAGERRRRVLTRTMERLPHVRGLVVRRADDLGVRAAAVVTAPAGVAIRPPEQAAVSWSGLTENGEPLLVEGPLADVEDVIVAARGAGSSSDALVVQPPRG